MALDAAAALRHAVNLGGLYIITHLQAGACQDSARQNGPLAANPGQQIVYFFHAHSPMELLFFFPCDRPGGTDLHTEAATGAHRFVDAHPILTLNERRAADIKTCPAIRAKFRIDPGRRSFFPGLQSARAPCNDHRGFFALQVVFEYLPEIIHLVGIAYVDLAKTQASNHSLQIDLDGRLLLQGVSGARMMLMPRHAGGAVVGYDRGRISPVIEGVDQWMQAGVEERGIANDRHKTIRNAPLVHPVGYTDARSHATAEMERLERRGRPKRVTTNIAHHYYACLLEDGKHPAVAATRAEGWGADRDRDLGRRRSGGDRSRCRKNAGLDGGLT